MTVEEKLIIRLDRRIQSERELSDMYRAIPRSRRQEVARRALLAGLRDAIQKEALNVQSESQGDRQHV